MNFALSLFVPSPRDDLKKSTILPKTVCLLV
jgi:hypothetical protein